MFLRYIEVIVIVLHYS